MPQSAMGNGLIRATFHCLRFVWKRSQERPAGHTNSTYHHKNPVIICFTYVVMDIGTRPHQRTLAVTDASVEPHRK